MRRLSIALLTTALVAVSAGPASAALQLQPNAVRVLTPAAEPADREPVFVARAGTRYRFEVGYRVSGARQIGTGHLFIFENAVTGQRLETLSKSFPPEAPGSYNESSELTIPSTWAPGVYRFRWRINARNTRLPSVSARGSHVFLVLGSSGSG
jgi:hypothetical protein